MKIKKIMMIISLAVMVTATGVACGNKETEDNNVVDNTIYLDKDIDNTDEKMVSIVDGEKIIDLGESLRGAKFYNPVKEEYIIFDRINFDKAEGNEDYIEFGHVVSDVAITAINKNGEKRIIDEVKMELPYLYDNNEYLYYKNDKDEIIQLNIETKEKVSIGTLEQQIEIIDVDSEYCIYKTADKIIAMNKKNKERIEIAESTQENDGFGMVTRVDSEYIFLNNDNEFVYFNLETGTIRTEKTEENDKVILVSTLGEVGDYFLYYSYDDKSCTVKRKKFGEMAEKITTVTIPIIRTFDKYFVYYSIEDNKEHFKIVDFNKKNIETLDLDEYVDYEDIAIIDDIIYYGTKDGVYKIENGKAEIVYEGSSYASKLFNLNEKLLEVRKVRRIDNKKQSQEYTYEIYLDGEKILDNLIDVIESNGEFLIKNYDGTMSSFIDEKVIEHKGIDIAKFNEVSIHSENESGNNYDKFDNIFDMEDIEGYWKSIDEKTGDIRYFKFYMNGFRRVVDYSNMGANTSFYSMDENLEANILNSKREDGKFIVEVEHKMREPQGEKEVVRVHENEIKFDGQTLKRISKEESDKAIKELMEKDEVYQEVALHAMDTSGQGVKLDEVMTLNGVDYYIVSSHANIEDKVVVREDGECFAYAEFTDSKEALNTSEGMINNLIFKDELEY